MPYCSLYFVWSFVSAVLSKPRKCSKQAVAVSLMAEELAPSHCRERPQWIDDLFKLCKTEFGRKQGAEAGLAEARKHSANFTATLPLCLLDVELMPIPGVYPLKGAVLQEMQQYYGERANQAFELPPPGTLLQVAAFKLPIEEADLGKLQRANLDLAFLAWLMRFDQALKQKDSKTIAYFRKASLHVLMDVRLVPSESRETGPRLPISRGRRKERPDRWTLSAQQSQRAQQHSGESCRSWFADLGEYNIVSRTRNNSV